MKAHTHIYTHTHQRDWGKVGSQAHTHQAEGLLLLSAGSEQEKAYRCIRVLRIDRKTVRLQVATHQLHKSVGSLSALTHLWFQGVINFDAPRAHWHLCPAADCVSSSNDAS